MADATEVREWGRANGWDVPPRGRIKADVQEAYDRAHEAGVTAADFDDDVIMADPPPLPEQPPLEETPPKPPRERAPRKVRGKAPAVAKPKGWRFWQSPAGGKPRGPRTDLSEFACDMWADLAMITAPLPPVSRVLTVQAPYAGVVFDQAVKGIPLVDSLLQPVARASVSLRALNGLIGPPVLTASICMDGEHGWQHDDTGRLVIDSDGRPVPTGPTAMKLGMLRYSLAQMARTADPAAVAERAAEDQARMAAVDTLIDFIFGFPPRSPAPDGGAAPAQGSQAPQTAPSHPGQDPIHPTAVFRYPPPPVMDGAGMPAGAPQ